jgi:hypothetical protein
MNRFFIIFISILLISICVYSYGTNFEKFEFASNTDYMGPYKSDTDKSKPIYYNQLDYKPVSNIKCCLVQQKYLPDSTNQFGGSFRYKFSPMKNEMCDLKKYRLDNTKQLFIDGYNGWTNNDCKEPNKLGSCRNINKECVDFVTKEYCDKYKMIWSNKTCRDPFKYIWVDRIKFNKPTPKDDGSYIMFDKESHLSKALKTSKKISPL